MSQKRKNLQKKKAIIKKNSHFIISSGYFLRFLSRFAHKCPNMKQVQKLWQILNFCGFCAHFDGFMSKINFLQFLVNLAGKETNTVKN